MEETSKSLAALLCRINKTLRHNDRRVQSVKKPIIKRGAIAPHKGFG